MLLYALLHLTGYPGMTMEELANFPPASAPRRPATPNSVTRPGIETTHRSRWAKGLGKCRRHGAG